MKILFATPTFDGKVCTQYLRSMLTTFSLCNMIEGPDGARIQASHAAHAGDVYVGRARNALATNTFLKSDCTHLFFIDADMGWDPQGVIKMIFRDVDMIAGVYPMKAENENYPVHLKPGPDDKAIIRNGLVEALRVPTGFLCIKRNVIERMIEAYPESKYIGSGQESGQNEECHELFPCGVTDKTWWGEDYDFSNLWRKIGGSMWIEPDIDFCHVGRPRIFAGNFHEYSAGMSNFTIEDQNA